MVHSRGIPRGLCMHPPPFHKLKKEGNQNVNLKNSKVYFNYLSSNKKINTEATEVSEHWEDVL